MLRPRAAPVGRAGYWSWLRVALVVVAVAQRRLGPALRLRSRPPTGRRRPRPSLPEPANNYHAAALVSAASTNVCPPTDGLRFAFLGSFADESDVRDERRVSARL